MERRETIAERLRQRAATIRAAGNDSGNVKDQNFIDGGISALEVLASDVEDGTFAWPSEHTTLVEQRDLLVSTLRELLSASIESVEEGKTTPRLRQSIATAHHALATVEQGGGA